MKTILFFFSATLAISALFGAIFFNANHLFIFSFMASVFSRILYVDKSDHKPSVKETIAPYIKAAIKTARSLKHIKIVVLHETEIN